METVDAQTMVDALEDLRENENIKALIIRVNSPGGQAWIADQMVREINKVKEQMPVVVSMSDVAASAGYMVACLGDTVFAQPNTITGSIGVFGLTFNAEQLLEDKMGIRTYHINTAEHADMGYPDRSDAYERQVFQTRWTAIMDSSSTWSLNKEVCPNPMSTASGRAEYGLEAGHFSSVWWMP